MRPSMRAVRMVNCRSRTSQVIKAFKSDPEVTHRVERLTGLTHEFIHHWTQGAKDGATEEVLGKFTPIMDHQITVKISHLGGSVEGKGVEAVKNLLIAESQKDGSMRPSKVVLCAANECDAVFALMEFEQVKGSGHKNYGIVKFDIMLDDTTTSVTGVTERLQVEPKDAGMLSIHQPKSSSTDLLSQAGLKHFPSDRVRETKGNGMDTTVPRKAMELACTAYSNGNDENKQMEEALDSSSFRLWDGYGLLPEEANVGGSKATAPADSTKDKNATMQMIKSLKEKYNLDCTLVDSAVSSTHNVGFAHWRSRVKSQSKEGNDVVLEAMEMHVFNDDGKITDTWTLRDPMPEEREKLMAAKSSK